MQINNRLVIIFKFNRHYNLDTEQKYLDENKCLNDFKFQLKL